MDSGDRNACKYIEAEKINRKELFDEMVEMKRRECEGGLL